MLSIIRKNSGKITVNVRPSEEDSTIVDVRRYCGGTVTPSGLSTLTIHAAPDITDPFYPYYDSDGTAVSMSVANSGIYQLPSTLYELSFAKFVGDGSGVIDLSLKT